MKPTTPNFSSENYFEILEDGIANTELDPAAVKRPFNPKIKSITQRARKLRKNNFNIVSYNTRTMSKDSHLFMMQEALKNINYDVIGLAELKRWGENLTECSDFILYSKGTSVASGSVGFIVRKKWKDNIEGFTGISDRVAVLKLKFCKESIGIVTVYAPTAEKSDPIINSFYDDVDRAIELISTCELQFLIGDWNSKIGQFTDHDSDVMGRFGFGERNARGQKLIDYARSNEFFITNTLFKKNEKRRATWISSRAANEIDFILIKNNSKSRVINFNVINQFSYESDHHPIRLKISLFAKKKFKKFTAKLKFKIDDDKLKREKFHENLQNENFETPITDVQNDYDTFIEKIKIAAVPYKIKNTKIDMISLETRNIIEEREQLRKIRNSSDEIQQKFKAKRKEANQRIKRDLKIHEMRRMETAIDRNQPIKMIKNGFCIKKNYIPKLKNESGADETNPNKIVEVAVNFYEDLYRSKLSEDETARLMPEISRDDDIIEEISIEELKTALKQLKNNRAPGDDALQSDLFKICDTKSIENLRGIFNEILRSETLPSQWLCSIIILIFKKGSKADIKNYRPISKISHVYKFFMRVILNRISPTLSEHQPITQAGFKKGFSVHDHLLVMNQLIEKSNEYQLPLYLGFLDYEKAFDSIEHVYIWRALKNQGVINKYIRIFKFIYDNSYAKLNVNGLDSRLFKIGRGVKQGDLTSPELFIATQEEIFKQVDWSQAGIEINGEKLAELRLADDTTIVAKSKVGLEHAINDLAAKSEKVGLKLNTNKTKILTNTDDDDFKLLDENIEKVNNVKYLGQHLSFDNCMEDEINKRVASAWRAFWSMKEFFYGSLPVYHKSKLLEKCVLPVLTYGAQSWTLTDNLKDKLRVAQHDMERKILNIRRCHKVSIKKIRKLTKSTDVIDRAMNLKWNFAGHVQRYSDNRWTKRVENWVPNNPRRRGRPKARWCDIFVENQTVLWRHKAQKRDQWRKGNPIR